MSEPVRLGDQRVCAVCARVLDRHSDGVDGPVVRWVHNLQDQPEDHLPVPVMPVDIHARYRCDFCSEDRTTPGWVIPAKDFPMPGAMAIGMSSGDWGACDRCAKLVAENRWDELIINAVRNQDPEMREFMSVGLARTYHRLRANMTGPPRKIEGGL